MSPNFRVPRKAHIYKNRGWWFCKRASTHHTAIGAGASPSAAFRNAWDLLNRYEHNDKLRALF